MNCVGPCRTKTERIIYAALYSPHVDDTNIGETYYAVVHSLENLYRSTVGSEEKTKFERERIQAIHVSLS